MLRERTPVFAVMALVLAALTLAIASAFAQKYDQRYIEVMTWDNKIQGFHAMRPYVEITADEVIIYRFHDTAAGAKIDPVRIPRKELRFVCNGQCPKNYAYMWAKQESVRWRIHTQGKVTLSGTKLQQEGKTPEAQLNPHFHYIEYIEFAR
jgi:hypothetical protein